MKRTIRRHILVYLGAALVAAGLFVGARVYVQYAEQKSLKTQEAAVAQARADAEQRLPKVKVVEIMPVPLTDYLVLPGTVRPYDDIDLAAKTTGSVTWIGPKEGDRVEKGKKVLQVEVKSVQTRVTEARARYEQAVKDYNRMKKLYEEQIVSRSQLDAAQTTLETSKAALEAAGLTLDDGSLSSPISGTLNQLNVDKGEYINPGQVVMKIVNIDKVKVELPVPEKDILYFEEGQHVVLELEQRNGETRTFTGVIEFVSLTADPTTRTYTVKVLVENPEHILRPGMIVRAQLVRRQLEAAIAVPFFCIIDREDGKAVFVVEDGVAHVRSIEYGIFQRGIVEIRSGLNVGDRLVIVGQRNLVDGVRVEVTDDLTPLARQWIQSGRDLSELPVEILE
jgi:membrane fusion protein, multidrug efflux system